ncbi:MAG: TIR domain-containing protein [Acidobacteriaceae bacterium]
MTFKYDVALSFAGEQRKEVEQVASCLRTASLEVFYDEYEKSNLWGKDLYVHLSDVYQNQAKYCIIFASKEYQEKNWTNLERQSAQARALNEKGNEYILPVRFDDTEIPGIPRTIGYLDFRREGAQGVCGAFLRKISAPESPPRLTHNNVCESSPRAIIQSIPLDTVAFPLVAELSWTQDSATIVVEPDEKSDGPFFDSLRQRPNHVIVAYSNNAGVGEVASVEHIVMAGKQKWKLDFRRLQTEFSSSMEMGTSGTTAEQFAEMRATRILLDENRHEQTSDYNKIMRESLVQGLDALLKIEKSPFVPLYRAYGGDPTKFLEIAWITAAMQLKIGRCVADLELLSLTLKGVTLAVVCHGKRARKYVNVDPYIIRIEGRLELHP